MCVVCASPTRTNMSVATGCWKSAFTTASTSIYTTNEITKRRISSIGFSGAGFLIAYHLGVAACFHDQQLLCLPLRDSNGSTSTDGSRHHKHNENPPHRRRRHVKFTGVSAGSIVAASLLANVDPATDGMNAVMQISRTTRDRARSLDALQPGFSLIDVVESVLKPLLHNATKDDPEWFLQRINTQGLLRVGLTDRRVFPPIGYNPNAFLYVDRFRCLDDIVSACILSSYIPGLTGPALGNMALKNHAVTRAAQRVDDMIRDGCVKKGTTGETISPSSPPSRQPQSMEQQSQNGDHVDSDSRNDLLQSAFGSSTREICWDGGLVNAFPTFDPETIIVSPIAADFRYNPSISPAIEYTTENSTNRRTTAVSNVVMGKVELNPVVTVYVTAANMANFKSMIISSDDDVLQNKFHQGYDNAKEFCIRNSLLNVHHHFISKL